MPTELMEPEVLAFLADVESGTISLVASREPQDVYAGAVEYAASNHWTLTIFNDANEWDYVEKLCTADGRRCDYDAIFAQMPRVDAYQPTEEVAWTRYRIPGHMRFRCVRCGQDLCEPRLRQPPYTCERCAAA